MELTEHQVRERLVQACKEAGGQKAWARHHGISVQYVNDVARYRRPPGDLIVRALGLRRVVRYEEDA